MMLLDTSGLFCLLHGDEPFHRKACSFYRKARLRLTHSYVLSEFIPLAISRHVPLRAAVDSLVDLLENPDIETIWVDEALNKEALNLLSAREDKAYSLCDAVSFVLMRRRKLREALTTDRHFEQEGFRRFLV